MAGLGTSTVQLGDDKYRKGLDDGYDIGYRDGREDALKDPMTFCVCEGHEYCQFVEDVADGTAETCWYCTFLDGEAPCPVEAEDAD